MKKLRTLGKACGILFGAIGISTLFTSCHKEKACDCTMSYSETYIDGSTYTFSQNVVINTEQKCWELNEEIEYSYGGSTYSRKTKCDK